MEHKIAEPNARVDVAERTKRTCRNGNHPFTQY